MSGLPALAGRTVRSEHPATPGDRETDNAIAARIMELSHAVHGFVGRMMRGSPGVAEAFADVRVATEDILGELRVVMWDRRNVWWPLDQDRQRAWTFVAARNLVHQARQTAHRHAKAIENAVHSTANLDPPEPISTDDEQLLAAVRALRISIEAVYGTATWERLVSKLARSGTGPLASQVIAALTRLLDGQRADLGPIARSCASWEGWASSRERRGLALDAKAAVAAGVFPNLPTARRNLAVWWTKHQVARNAIPTAHGLVAAGLVNDTPRNRGESQADALLTAASHALAGMTSGPPPLSGAHARSVQ